VEKLSEMATTSWGILGRHYTRSGVGRQAVLRPTVGSLKFIVSPSGSFAVMGLAPRRTERRAPGAPRLGSCGGQGQL